MPAVVLGGQRLSAVRTHTCSVGGGRRMPPSTFSEFGRGVVAVFDDRASGSDQLDFVVRGPDSTAAAARDAAIERDYEALRRPLRAMVRTDFPWLRDFDALYQEAWTDLLELEARGGVVQNRKALLK